MQINPTPAAFQAASREFQNATGPIDYQMTNDYMFHATLQNNPKVLKGLICSLLGLRPKDIRSIQLLNPIVLGESAEGKTFILDIILLLNDDTSINLEMQAKKLPHWDDRSLSYLCRSFDRLLKGNDYSSARPAIHIGFLDFTPFPEFPEFYASYKLLNEKNHHVYSDKFILRMVNLTRIDLATDKDRACCLDHWARLFKATTWEEIKMIAKHDADLLEASETLFTLNADDLVRRQCEARADYYRLHNTINRKLHSLNSEILKLNSKNQNLNSTNQVLNSKNQVLNSKIQDLNSKNQDLSSKNQDLSSKIQEQDIRIAQLEAQLAGKQPPV